MPVRTVPDLVQRSIHEHGPRTALRYPRDGDWHPITYGQLGRLLEDATLGLVAAEVDPGDAVACWAPAGPQSVLVHLASLHAGATVATIDPDRSPGEVGDRLAGVEPSAVFLGPEQADALPAEAVPEGSRVVRFEASPGLEAADEDGGASRWSTTELYRRGQRLREDDPSAFADRWTAIEPDEPAHRRPEGQPLTQAQVLRQARGLASRLELAAGDRWLSTLDPSDPLHRAGLLAVLGAGGQCWPARSPAPLVDDLQACVPDVLAADRPAYAAIREHLDERLAASQPTQRRLFDWARSVGERCVQARSEGGSPGWGLRLRYGVADRLVLDQARAALGLEQARAALTVSLSPARPARWLRSIGIPVREAASSRTAGLVVALAGPGQARPGSLGRPLPGVEATVDADETGAGPLLVHAGDEAATRIDTGIVCRRDDKGALEPAERPSAEATPATTEL